ncbi:MAG: o-succinylbenzoate synthase [Melioribacteraceae bacterium]|nr:o-succinylbenzoate synthase [Melioribacteraceae bacterium]
MIIKNIKYIKYRLPLRQPILTSKFKLNERSGLIIRLEDSNGNIGYGEASPLDGFSNETLDEAENEIKSFINQNVDFNVEFDPTTKTYKSANTDIKSPSFSLAFEQALFSLMLVSGYSSLESFGLEAIHEIKFNGLVDITGESNTLERIEGLLKQGFDTIKLKIGRENFHDDLNLLKSIDARFGNGVNLRLDVNGKWSKEEAVENLNGLDGFNIEYVEQPCKKLEDLISLLNHSPVKIAVDESIKNINQLNDLVNTSAFTNIVVKPMQLGNFFELIRIIERSKDSGKNIILSSTFETNLGKLVLLFLSQFGDHKVCHGFATDGIFEKNILDSPFVFKSAKITFSKKMLTGKLNLELLFNE